MAFSDPVRREARRKSHYCCCLCTHPFVEVHHIIPQEDKGPDTLDNAAPLCARCHGLFGGNPGLRRQIKEKRDMWWELCEKNPTAPQLALNRRLDELWQTAPLAPGAKEKAEFLAKVRQANLEFHREATRKLESARTEKELVEATGVPLPGPFDLPQSVRCPTCGEPSQFVGINPSAPYANVSYRCSKHGAFYAARVDGFDD